MKKAWRMVVAGMAAGWLGAMAARGEEVSGVTLYGDVNCDGVVDLADCILLEQYLNDPSLGPDSTEEIHVTAQGKLNADVVDPVGGGDWEHAKLTWSDKEAIEMFILEKGNIPQCRARSAVEGGEGSGGVVITLVDGEGNGEVTVDSATGGRLDVVARLDGAEGAIAGVWYELKFAWGAVLKDIEHSSPALNGAQVTVNDDKWLAACISLRGRYPIQPTTGAALLTFTVEVPAGTAEGRYEVGLDTCRVYRNGTTNTYAVSVTPLTVVVGPPEPGSEKNPIEIASLKDWEALAARAATNGTAGVHYKQTADIEGVKTPVGGFAGVYEGNGKRLAVALSGTEQCLAPFTWIDGAVIRNLTVAGTVEGGTHCAGLAGSARGTNRIENCEVSAAVATSGTHCGGFVGHGGTSETTLSGCVFSGSVGTTASTTNLATFWGWSNDGAKPVLEKCLDASDSAFPIGLGFPDPGTAGVRNTYYLRGDKTTSTWRAWSYGGKQGFAVTGADGVRVELAEGGAGLAHGGTVYAGKGETVRLRLACDIDGATFVASAGSLAKDGDEWVLSMPGEAVTIWGGVGVPYVDPTDGGKVKWCAVYEGAAGTTAWEDGTWYVAEGETEVAGRIGVTGSANLILADGAKLAAKQGIRVNKGASLTIWGQVGGSGRLEATGGASWAGIGGEWYEGQETSENRHCGAVTVNGGVVVAQGGQYGAGIGGGDTGDGGVVRVNGGVVEATGKEGSAGIGGGDYGNGGEFTLTGGKVTARGSTRTSQKSGQASPGIGAGRPSPDGGQERISGKVTIRGGELAAFAGVPGTNGNAHATAAQAIGVNVDDADYNEANNANWLTLGEVAVYTSEAAAEPVLAGEREEACRGTNVWVRTCPHRLDRMICVWCGATVPPELPGKGTEEEPYLIGDYETLLAFAMVVNGTHPTIGKNAGACGVVTNDIVATGTDWTPIAVDGGYFGTFDGGGHTIRGLSNEGVAKAPGDGGLFYIVIGGTVRNVRLESVYIQGKDYSGGIVGFLSGGTVSNCCVFGSVSGHVAGGIVGGNASGGTVANCWASGSVSGDWAGGVAGLIQEEGAIASYCYSVCEVAGSQYCGGIAGLCQANGTVANSYCLERVGVVGLNQFGTASECGELTAEEFRDAGNFKGWDFGNVWMMGPDRPFLRVFGAPLELTVESGWGETAGQGHYRGEAVEARMEGSPVPLGTGLRAACTGWVMEGNEPGGGTGTVARFTLTNAATLRWTWETQALVRVEAGAHGTASGGGWVAVGGTARLAAAPEAGHPFTGWEGDWGASAANPLEVAVTGPGTARATFYTTYYAGADGNDEADGLGRESAVREIATALERAASGDTVVADAGRYGAVEVPSGVTVKGEAGAEGTVIDGGGRRRCVVAEAGAVVEGVALEGGYAEGDGGGALLEAGAALKRCIVRGCVAALRGGGAKGGMLENCLVVSNRAAAGGGAAGAVLRHCTVARNAGGGAKDCRTANSVFWENDGGDAAGGSTEWSLCNPAAEGQGNIEGNPLFAGEGDWRLAFGSPCINAAGTSETKVDLAGAPRPQPKVYGEAAAADMGCYEYVPKARFVWKEGKAVPPYESWADAARDIQSALDASGDGDRVVVEAGVYEEGVAMSNAVVLMGYRGAEKTVIDGGGSRRPVTMQAGGVLEGFTVRNGNVSGGGDCGGGIWADGGAVVRNVTVVSNRASEWGGGVYAKGRSVVERCVLKGNEAWKGGGAYLEDECRLLGCEVVENSAACGGGVYALWAEVAGCELEGNTASNGAGGGTYVVGGTFNNNRVGGNSSGSDIGGGLCAINVFGHDCLVVGNEGGRGAGVYMTGGAKLWNFTVSGNTGSGAGVYVGNESVLGNSIVWGNAGGEIEAEEGTDVRNCWTNDPKFVGDGDCHLRAGSPCVDKGERQDWMPEASDFFDGQRRVEPEGDGRDSLVDIGADEAAVDAVEGPSGADASWTWRVVPDARLQAQSTTNLVGGAGWRDEGAEFVATNGVWKMEEKFGGTGAKFRRLIWRKE